MPIRDAFNPTKELACDKSIGCIRRGCGPAPLDTRHRCAKTTFMTDDDSLPRRANDPLSLISRQDLDPFSVDELRERIDILTSEIARTSAKIEGAVSHRAGADALFRR